MKKAVVFVESYSRKFPYSSSYLSKVYNALSKAYRKHHQSRIIPSIRTLSKKYDLSVVAMDQSTSSILKKVPHIYGPALIDIDKVDEKSMSFVRSFTETHPQLKGMLSYDGYNLWELEEADIWDGFVRELIRRIEIIRAVLKKNRPDTIVVLNRNSPIGRASMCFPLKTEDLTPYSSGIIHLLRSIMLDSVLKYVFRKYRRLADSKDKTKDKAPKKLKGGKVLLFTDTTRMLPSTLPWSTKLSQDISLLVIGLEENETAIKRVLPFRPFSTYVTKDVASRIKSKWSELASSFRKLKSDKKLQKSIAYEGISICNPLSDMFRFLFSIGFPRSIAYIEACNSVIKKERPNLGVVYGDRMNLGRSVCRVFERHSVQTLIIQFGLVNETPHFGPIFSTKMALFGDCTKNILVKRGNSPSRLVITGQPRFDSVFSQKCDPLSAYKTFNIDRGKKIILYASEGIHDDHDRLLFSAVMRAEKKLPGTQLIIKLHPDEDPGFAHDFKKRFKSNVIITKHSLYQLISSSSVFLSSFSTTAMEAALFYKPIIIINLSGQKDRIDCVKERIAIGVYKEKYLVPAIKKALYNRREIKRLGKEIKKYNLSHLYKSDGKASERVAGLVESMAK